VPHASNAQKKCICQTFIGIALALFPSDSRKSIYRKTKRANQRGFYDSSIRVVFHDDPIVVYNHNFNSSHLVGHLHVELHLHKVSAREQARQSGKNQKNTDNTDHHCCLYEYNRFHLVHGQEEKNV
jgi:hypothetical protein